MFLRSVCCRRTQSACQHTVVKQHCCHTACTKWFARVARIDYTVTSYQNADFVLVLTLAPLDYSLPNQDLDMELAFNRVDQLKRGFVQPEQVSPTHETKRARCSRALPGLPLLAFIVRSGALTSFETRNQRGEQTSHPKCCRTSERLRQTDQVPKFLTLRIPCRC